MKIAMLYSSFSNRLPSALESAFTEVLGPTEYVHIGESGMLDDVVKHNGLSKKLLSRLMGYYYAAANCNPDCIICTCSSIGRSAELAAQLFDGPAILRIDEPMARYAVEHYSRIALLATVDTTLGPSSELIRRVARDAHREVELTATVATGAWEAMRAGRQNRYTALLCETARDVARNSDVIVLAQASMAQEAPQIQAFSEKPTLSSPQFCAQHLQNVIKTSGKRSDVNESL